MSEIKTVTIESATTIEALLAGYPQLEPVLCDLIPKFGTLKSGFFRDTIARTTTLEQAASTGRLRLPDLINKLRRIAGLPDDATSSNFPGMPLWVSEGKTKNTLDARAMLAQGEHPKGIVLRELSSLSDGEMFVLITPFVPGPLIEIARSQGFQTWTKQGEKGIVETYFSKGQ
jgi:hypothetical protein